MSGFRLNKWNGKELLKKVDSEEDKRLTKAAIHLQNQIKGVLGTKGAKCGSGDSGGRSAPGDPPHLECGTLRNSITYEVDKRNDVARVGTNVKHGKFQELGTRKQSARPFLRPTLAQEKNAIAKILAGKIPGL